jgi:hypothetical protein
MATSRNAFFPTYVDFTSASGTEDPGFESRQGVRCSGLSMYIEVLLSKLNASRAALKLGAIPQLNFLRTGLSRSRNALFEVRYVTYVH